MKITRRIEFDAGHRLLNHESKCAYLHGHRYAAEITVEAPALDGVGRVIDFGVVKADVGAWIDTHWDHNLILHPDDPIFENLDVFHGLLPPHRQRLPYALYWRRTEPLNPTAENMAAVLFHEAAQLLGRYDNIHVTHVRLYETPNCWADYE